MFDRRVINNYYSPRAMELLSILNRFIVFNEINLTAQQPRILSDSITIVQGYESQPLDSGVSIAWRLSRDGSEVLVFEPEVVEGMYDLADWTIGNLADSSASARLPWDDLISLRVRDLLIGGQGGSREEMESNLARWRHDQFNG